MLVAPPPSYVLLMLSPAKARLHVSPPPEHGGQSGRRGEGGGWEGCDQGGLARDWPGGHREPLQSLLGKKKVSVTKLVTSATLQQRRHTESPSCWFIMFSPKFSQGHSEQSGPSLCVAHEGCTVLRRILPFKTRFLSFFTFLFFCVF